MLSRRHAYLALGCMVLIIASGLGYYAMRPAGEPTPPDIARPSGSAPVSGRLPDPLILEIDRGAIMRSSNVGQDVNRQIQAFAVQAKAAIDQQSRALQKEGQQMQGKLATLSPDAKQKWISSFESRQAALREAAQRKDDQLKDGLTKARGAMEQAVGPILQQVAKEHGANLVLDKQAMLFSNESGLDITAEVIKKLNDKLPSYKIVLAPEK